MKNDRNDPRKQLAEVPADLRLLFTNVSALRMQVEDATKQFIFRAAIAETGTDGTDPYHIPNSRSRMLRMARGNDAKDFAIAKALLATLEATEEFKRAAAVVEPLLAAVTEVEVKEQREAEAKRRAEYELELAREKARRKATELSDNDPEVVAVKQRFPWLK